MIRLNALLAERRITRARLLRAIGLNGTNITNWEKRDSIPSGETLINIARYLNVSVDYLLGLSDSRETNDDNTECQIAEAEVHEFGLDGVYRIKIFKLTDEQRQNKVSSLKLKTGNIEKIKRISETRGITPQALIEQWLEDLKYE